MNHATTPSRFAPIEAPDDLDGFGEVSADMGRSRRAQALDRLTTRNTCPRTLPWPEKLPLASIRVAPDAFSVRGSDLDNWHLDDLTAALRALRALGTDGDLDPILVIPSGSSFIVVDGHYRFEVYSRAGRFEIPVEVFDGTPAAALLEASRRAGKVSLVLNNQQRQDLAWDLTRTRRFSIRQIRQAAGVSESQVSLMREALARLGDEALDMSSWHHARDLANGREYAPADLTEEELAAKARDIAKAIGKVTGPRLRKSPELAARVFRDLMGHTIGRCVAELHNLGCVPEENGEDEQEEA